MRSISETDDEKLAKQKAEDEKKAKQKAAFEELLSELKSAHEQVRRDHPHQHDSLYLIIATILSLLLLLLKGWSGLTRLMLP